MIQKKFYDGYYNGMIDTQTLKPISLKTQARAAAVMRAFGPIIQTKKLRFFILHFSLL